MRQIELTLGFVMMVDDHNYDRIAQHSWSADKIGHKVYASRRFRVGGRTVKVYAHREIMNALKGEEIDHKNGSGLDNRESNLRRCTRAQNIANQKRRVDNTSGIKGVRIIKAPRGDRYLVRVTFQGKEHHGGCFKSLDDAAAAYLKKAKELFGEFARAS